MKRILAALAIVALVGTAVMAAEETASKDITLKGKSNTSGSGADNPLVMLDSVRWWKTIQPTDYKNTYSNGTSQGRWFKGGYKVYKGVNFATPDRPNIVYTMDAYNIASPNGSTELTNEAGWDWTVETDYDNSGSKPYGDFEWHQRMYSTDGNEHRGHSWYVNKTNGGSRHDFEGNVFTFIQTQGVGKPPFTFAYLQEASFDLHAINDGRVVGFTATGFDGTKVQISEAGGIGFLKVPGVIDGSGYGHTKIFLPTSPTGLVSGESYWKTITVNGETFDVITRVK